MIIHVVQSDDTIQSIAEYYGISVDKLIQDNGLIDPDNLVVGQSIVIVEPETIYTVKEGDTLLNIANSYNMSVIQLLANNPYLSDREYLYPGDSIVISYTRKELLTTHGNTVPTINKATLRKTLPYLTYISVLNYTATNSGEIISYYDDTEIIQISKAYGVAPLMLLTTLTIQGEANLRVDFDLLLNEDFQNRQIENILTILKSKGYLGLNLSLQYISLTNIQLYENYFIKVTNRLNSEGYQVFVTINPNINLANNEVTFQKVDYSIINRLAQNIIFTSYEWAFSINPPSPITSISQTEVFLEYVLNYIPPDKIIIGIATLGYDWELPYVAGVSNVNLISFDNVNAFAKEYDATIQFDDVSLTPYFTYTTKEFVNHVVWFIHSRTINAILDLVSKYNLKGISIWNITVFNPQLWLLVNSQYEIEKIIF
ncbi:spore germination protein YaaH [Anaerocolumna cellulosilytica]|uniref:Spore germination protein YaaH n=1 Tax=Anaerocolumna cellulosilytica TaxID=433286 RepID=A0A6S6R1X3_9FIRM|nr:LysM peptidoglycan-binding domain-containing protein [Anaerocolumna cellulosilytica]MBB5195656.1 spore germination protein [Anaerocolumna cellulosilytica]BCJ93008.1 spore germination protein YaaH [Anaerocolumna cellulosilytica]